MICCSFQTCGRTSTFAFCTMAGQPNEDSFVVSCELEYPDHFYCANYFIRFPHPETKTVDLETRLLVRLTCVFVFAS